MAKPVNDSAIVPGGQKVSTDHTPLQFGFTSAGGGGGGLKSTLFSRMSPNAKGSASVAANPNTFAEAAKIAKTQGSTGNI